MVNKKAQALYIHIPFCHQLCDYCDFAKMYVNENLVEQYMKALIIEMQLKIATNDCFTTIYVGGGTPSTLSSEYVQQLFLFLKPHILGDAEITFEMNPEDVTAEYVEMLASCGVNRISLGVQSFSDELIQRVGRNHTAKQSLDAIQILKTSSISNITFDLMFALPGQTVRDLTYDLEMLKQLDLPHISIYSLILEKRTKLYLQQKQYQFVDEDIEAEMYHTVIESLNQMGYTQYEMSNFAKESVFESRHNLAYWHQQHYYGVGLGAHQFIGNVRSANTKSINAYINKLTNQTLPISDEEILNDKQLFEEFCFLSFRDCIRGLQLSILQSRYQETYMMLEHRLLDILEGLIQQELVEMYEARMYRLTLHGKMLANEVFQAFIDIE